MITILILWFILLFLAGCFKAPKPGDVLIFYCMVQGSKAIGILVALLFLFGMVRM